MGNNTTKPQTPSPNTSNPLASPFSFPILYSNNGNPCGLSGSFIESVSISLSGNSTYLSRKLQDGKYYLASAQGCPNCGTKPQPDFEFNMIRLNQERKTFGLMHMSEKGALCLVSTSAKAFFLPCQNMDSRADYEFDIKGNQIVSFPNNHTLPINSTETSIKVITYKCGEATSNEECEKKDPKKPVFDNGSCRERKDTDCQSNTEVFQDGKCRKRGKDDCPGKIFHEQSQTCADPKMAPKCAKADLTKDQSKNTLTGWASCAECEGGYTAIYDHQNFAFCVKETNDGDFRKEKYSALYFIQDSKYWCPSYNSKDEGTSSNTLHLSPCEDVNWKPELSLHPADGKITTDEGGILATFAGIVKDDKHKERSFVYLRTIGEISKDDRKLSVQNDKLIFDKDVDHCAKVEPCKDNINRCPGIVSRDLKDSCVTVGFATVEPKQ